MNALLDTAAPALAWALIDFLWQGLLVGWAAALLLALMRKARPQARYAVACGALLLCAALPLAGTVQRMAEADAGPVTSMLPMTVAGQVAGVAAKVPVVAIDPGRFAGWEMVLQERLPLVVLFWSLGAGVLALRMVCGLAWVRRRSRPGQYRLDPAWQARLDQMARGMGVARRVTLGLVDDLTSPVTAGWWRPVVLVPASLVSGMPPQLLEALLAHELAHVRRCDYVVNLIQSAIEILLFYHPAVWWLSNRIREEREQIADDVAASTLGEPRRLALALSELDLFQFTPQLAPAAHGGNLMSRIKRLVRPEAEPLNWKLALPILGLATAAAFYSWSAPVHAAAEQAAPAPAPAAAPAPAPRTESRSETRSERRVVHREGREDSYAVVRADDKGTTMTGSSDDWDEIKEARRRIGGNFLWFREGGKAYYIQDAGVLARVDAAWAPMNKLGAQMDVYGKEMDVHGKKMDVLGKEMDVAARGFKPDEGKMRAIEARMKVLGEEMEMLGKQMGATDSIKERERLERRMSELGQQMSVAGNEMGQVHNEPGMRQAQKSMEQIGKRMSKAGEPMDAIGKKMGALGKEMERESKAADKTVRGLIREAREKGLAKPVPQAG